MSDCKEYVLDDLMAVTAIPVGNIPAGDQSSPANALTPTIAADGFSPAMTGAITIGLEPAASGVALIPIVRHTGKVKDDESDSAAGRLHTVTVSCDVDDRDGTVWADLLKLERTQNHLLLTFRDGVTRGFVCASQDTYLCNVARDGAKTTVTFRIQNLMGVQLIVGSQL